MIAVACSDNKIRLISPHSGKTVHQLSASPPQPGSTVSCLSWSVNFTDGPKVHQQLADSVDHVNLDDLLNQSTKVQSLLKTKADLPRELALLDIEVSLPRLSPLPTIGGE